jgi:hypothetical protein
MSPNKYLIAILPPEPFAGETFFCYAEDTRRSLRIRQGFAAFPLRILPPFAYPLRKQTMICRLTSISLPSFLPSRSPVKPFFVTQRTRGGLQGYAKVWLHFLCGSSLPLRILCETNNDMSPNKYLIAILPPEPFAGETFFCYAEDTRRSLRIRQGFAAFPLRILPPFVYPLRNKQRYVA